MIGARNSRSDALFARARRSRALWQYDVVNVVPVDELFLERSTQLDLSQPVVVVDDFTTMTRIISNLLRQLRFQNVDWVHDDNEALAKLRAGQYAFSDRLEHGADERSRPA